MNAAHLLHLTYSCSFAFGHAERQASSTILFKPGLNVVRGGNSRGKTQVLQAIIFALGLEGLFGPTGSSQLGSAFTKELIIEQEGAPEETVAEVLSSYCAVELENDRNEVLTAQRAVLHPVMERALIRTWNAPMITNSPTNTPVSDDYV